MPSSAAVGYDAVQRAAQWKRRVDQEEIAAVSSVDVPHASADARMDLLQRTLRETGSGAANFGFDRVSEADRIRGCRASSAGSYGAAAPAARDQLSTPGSFASGGPGALRSPALLLGGSGKSTPRSVGQSIVDGARVGPAGATPLATPRLDSKTSGAGLYGYYDGGDHPSRRVEFRADPAFMDQGAIPCSVSVVSAGSSTSSTLRAQLDEEKRKRWAVEEELNRLQAVMEEGQSGKRQEIPSCRRVKPPRDSTGKPSKKVLGQIRAERASGSFAGDIRAYA
eukprot:TRINITY_DN38798_c0_g1_i1.p1 TRINITY_DN38798_c0_g1~~TRINITY_DN38798_c0_g1_i1.p1  ORF type:complete len:281 (+),score=53.09 TRINITY_DN38798_c0_g1_i1:89-931(+)